VHTVVGVMASTELAMVDKISATVKRVESWFSDTGGDEYMISHLLDEENVGFN
jgi:hypothetical protein